MKQATTLLVAVILSAITAFTITKLIPAPSTTIQQQETAYERVVRTNTLRCGYGVFAPYFTRDAATGELGGIWHDFTEAMANHLGLKVVWAEEVGLGDISVTLDARRIDVYCGGLWTAGKRVRVVNFLRPSAYEPMLVYVRTDDHRFDTDISAINNPDVKISSLDGEGGGLVAMEEFPKATMASLPQLSNYADMFNQVTTKKADVVLAAPSGASVFIKNNPGVLRPLLNQPTRIFPVAMAVRYNEYSLRDMLNQAQDDIIYNGVMNGILNKYELNKGDFWRVAKPYEATQ